MPYAVQYGMTPHQFWFDDERLLEAYKKAYWRNVYVVGHIQGAYNFDAFTLVMSNAFAKKDATPNKYPTKITDPFEKPKDPVKVQQSTEQQFRQNSNFWASIGNPITK